MLITAKIKEINPFTWNPKNGGGTQQMYQVIFVKTRQSKKYYIEVMFTGKQATKLKEGLNKEYVEGVRLDVMFRVNSKIVSAKKDFLTGRDMWRTTLIAENFRVYVAGKDRKKSVANADGEYVKKIDGWHEENSNF